MFPRWNVRERAAAGLPGSAGFQRVGSKNHSNAVLQIFKASEVFEFLFGDNRVDVITVYRLDKQG